MSSKGHPLKPGDVLPGHVLRDEHGFNAGNRPSIVVNPDEVPHELRKLIPHVERWAIPCDVTRGDVFEKEGKDGVASFYDDVKPHTAAINAWLDAQPADVGDWPEAAVHFMYLLKAHGEAWQPTPEEKREIEDRLAAREAKTRMKRAIEQGLAAFQAKDYATVVAEFDPYEDELTGSAAAKLRLARKKTSAGQR